MSPLLDPRTFPIEEIAHFVHALPPPGEEILVADLPGATLAIDWLNAHGRRARLVPAPLEPQETRLWRPSPGLIPVVEALPPGTALDLGCGTGRDAVYLALHGWDVTAVDHLPDALERAKSLATLHNVNLRLIALDVDQSPLPPGPYDLVTAFRFLPSLTQMASALAPGGSLVVETFTDRERERTGKPKSPTLVLPHAAAPSLPPNLTLRHYSTSQQGPRELAHLWATAN